MPNTPTQRLSAVTEITSEGAADLIRPTALSAWMTPSSNGRTLPESLLEHLARAVGADYTFVATPLEDGGRRARITVSHPSDLVGAEFELTGSACAALSEWGTLVYPDTARRFFPADTILDSLGANAFAGAVMCDLSGIPIGWIGVVGVNALGSRGLTQELTELVADCVAAEMRDRRPSRLSKEAQALEATVPPIAASIPGEKELGNTEGFDLCATAVAALAASMDGFWDWSLPQGRVRYSARWCELLGLGNEMKVDTPAYWTSRLHPDDKQPLLDILAEVTAGDRKVLHCEHRLRHLNDSWRSVVARGVVLHDERGQPERIVGWLSDISEQKEMEEQLVNRAFRDRLTGLPNRTLFMDRLTHVVDTAQRHPERRYAMLLLNLDDFHRVNARFSETEGDEVLATVAQRLSVIVRPEDTLACLGGDRFAVIIDDENAPNSAPRIAERILRSVASPVKVTGDEVYLTGRIGIATSESGYRRATDVIRDASTALSRVPKDTTERFAVFDGTMHDAAAMRLQLEMDLRRALERSEFELQYQPIVAAADGKVTAFEALIRWRHPMRGLLTPASFLAVAVDSGLIIPMGRWVMSEVCKQSAIFDRLLGERVPITVNLTARQLAHPDFLTDVGRALAETGVDPEALVFEITEDAFIEEPEKATKLLSELRDRGIRLLVDDFGTGYSSLSYLRDLPVHGVKIDRTFLRGVELPGTEREIVRAIVCLAHVMGLEVVAEGVETQAQLDASRELGCDHAQGYFLARPMEGAEAVLDTLPRLHPEAVIPKPAEAAIDS